MFVMMQITWKEWKEWAQRMKVNHRPSPSQRQSQNEKRHLSKNNLLGTQILLERLLLLLTLDQSWTRVCHWGLIL